MKARKRNLSPDCRGCYRPYIGMYLARDGRSKPKRFNLGNDLKEAQQRYSRIHALLADNGGRMWNGRILDYAHQIAQGSKPRFSLHPEVFGENLVALDSGPEAYAQALVRERRQFPSLIDLQPNDPARYAESVEANRVLIQAQLRQLQAELEQSGALQAANMKLPIEIIPGTFHEALDDYETEFCRDAIRLPSGELKQTERKRMERVARFKVLHIDCPLHELTKHRIFELVNYWRKRPPTTRGTPSSRSHVKHQIGELLRFLKWLDGTDRYPWNLPTNLGSISKRIARFEHEKKLTAVTKRIYSPLQLAQINSKAIDLERLALYLGLNCALGAAELGRLVETDFALNEVHPFAVQLGFHSTSNDGWLRTFRPKTTVFGEWYLWPETVELVRWGIERAKRLGSDLIFCRDDGKPLYNDDGKKPDAGFANLWRRCQIRCGIELRLPFGSLRDTLPDFLRQTYNSELASICLTHGKPGVDKLIDCYANRPFGKLHRAIRESRAFFAPIFEHHIRPT